MLGHIMLDERQYQLTQNDITNMNLKSYFKQNSRYAQMFIL